MSGIAGMVRDDGGPVDLDLLDRMNAYQEFRGPHGMRVWAGNGAGLAHALLRISDREVPHPQPRTLEGSVWIAAHARIDGRCDLIHALNGRNQRADESATDADLILHAYHAWGERCTEHLIGDFTFALWDGPNRRLFCAVDHFGIRPFFYAHVAGTLVFSNTLDCVRLHPGVSTALDDVAIGDFLLFGHYKDRDRTVYADIKRLPPAHRLIFSLEKLTVQRYFEYKPEEEFARSRGHEFVDEFRSLLDTATSDRLRTDNVAIYMSGGIDSTSVAASAVRVLSSRGRRGHVTAYTCDVSGLIPDDEKVFARAAAARLAIDFRLQPVDDFSPFDWVARQTWPMAEPVNEPNWSMYVGSLREVADHQRLVLTGWEGDLPLSTSLRHHWVDLVTKRRWTDLGHDLAWYVLHERGFPPVGIRTAIARARQWGHVHSMPDWLADDFKCRADLGSRWARYAYQTSNPFPRHPRHEIHSFPEWSRLFDLYDPGSTGCALEAAHPLMDLRVLRFMMRLPPVPWCIGKRILRDAAVGSLPGEIISRPKTPVAEDLVRASLRRTGGDPALYRDVLREASHYIDASRFPDPTGVDWVDEKWANLRVLSFACWLRATNERSSENGQRQLARRGA